MRLRENWPELKMSRQANKIGIRNQEEIRLLKKSGEITAKALKKVLDKVKIGISLLELDKIAEEEIIGLGGESSFKSVPEYKFTTCLTLNEEIVHGLPRPIKLSEGDVLSVDLGVVYPPAGGWHTDAAWSVLVSDKEKRKNEKRKEEFLRVGEQTLWEAVQNAVEGKRIGDISAAIQKKIEGQGCFVVKSLAGHGVGRASHEEPEIPTFGQEGTGIKLKRGMSLAIEVIYTASSGGVILEEDGWTIASKKGNLAGLFEMSVIVGKKKPEVLTDWRRV